MKRIFVSSPLLGNLLRNAPEAVVQQTMERNRQFAEQYCWYVAQLGHTPFAPHVFYASFLDDTIPAQREQGIKMGLAELRLCQEVWVFLHRNQEVSSGMQREIALAIEIGIPVLFVAAEATSEAYARAHQTKVATSVVALTKTLFEDYQEVRERAEVREADLPAFLELHREKQEPIDPDVVNQVMEHAKVNVFRPLERPTVCPGEIFEAEKAIKGAFTDTALGAEGLGRNPDTTTIRMAVDLAQSAKDTRFKAYDSMCKDAAEGKIQVEEPVPMPVLPSLTDTEIMIHGPFGPKKKDVERPGPHEMEIYQATQQALIDVRSQLVGMDGIVQNLEDDWLVAMMQDPSAVSTCLSEVLAKAATWKEHGERAEGHIADLSNIINRFLLDYTPSLRCKCKNTDDRCSYCALLSGNWLFPASGEGTTPDA